MRLHPLHPKTHPMCKCRLPMETGDVVKVCMGTWWETWFALSPHVSFLEGGTCSRASCSLGLNSLVIIHSTYLGFSLFSSQAVRDFPPPSTFQETHCPLPWPIIHFCAEKTPRKSRNAKHWFKAKSQAILHKYSDTDNVFLLTYVFPYSHIHS
jgi:hypothetical protein